MNVICGMCKNRMTQVPNAHIHKCGVCGWVVTHNMLTQNMRYGPATDPVRDYAKKLADLLLQPSPAWGMLMPRRLSKHEMDSLPKEKAFYTKYLTAWKRWSTTDIQWLKEDDDKDLFDVPHGTILTSPWNGEAWGYKKRFESKCGAGGGNVRGRGAHAVPPKWNCTCGIYADKLSNRMQAENEVFGTIAVWGTILEWTEGYRAEFAYPTLIVVPDHLVHQVRSLKDGYGVTTITWTEFAKAITGEEKRVDESGPKNIIVKPDPHGYGYRPKRRRKRF